MTDQITYTAGQMLNNWSLQVTDEPSFKALHATLEWEPYLHVGDGYKALGYRRSDGMGYVLPCVAHRTGEAEGDWWATWMHPMQCGRPGWHHHAFGRYSGAMAAAMAFDQVYDLERIAGNTDRCPELRAPVSQYPDRLTQTPT